jgi:hypothetical protein
LCFRVGALQLVNKVLKVGHPARLARYRCRSR